MHAVRKERRGQEIVNFSTNIIEISLILALSITDQRREKREGRKV